MTTRLISLTQGQVATVDEEQFERLAEFKWHAYWSKHTCSFYAKRNSLPVDGKRMSVWMHREIIGASRFELVDHVNHNSLDNRMSNLRICSNSQNQHNRRIDRDSSSGLKGVTWSARYEKWYARIVVSGRRIHIGYYDDKKEAAMAYDAAAVKYCGEFAMTNQQLGLLL